MPNLENLKDMIAERLEKEEREVCYSSVDLTYTYGQVPLHALTAKHCNFQNIGGESTGSYRFVFTVRRLCRQNFKSLWITS